MAEGRKEYVWYPAEDKEEWRLCQLLSRTPGGGTSLRFNQKEILVPPEEVRLICPRDGSQQNLASLEKDGLGDSRVEDAIRNQFCNQNPYSNIDEITLCVNPFRYLPIFDETFIDKYASLDANLPPHIFNASARAYQRSMTKKESQVLCLLGDRCSGKSKAMEHLLCFLGQTAGDGDEEFKRMLEVIWPFLSISSSFGRNSWLSTRAMLEVDLGFAADGFICHTQLKARCLEAHRVAQRGNAKNFDALYLAAKDEDAAATWLGDTTEFRILGDEIDLEEYDESGDARKRWRDAMDAAGMDHGEIARSLCSLILLGEIQFSSSLQCEPAGALDAAAKALGVNAGALLGALLAGAETAEKAAEQRDAALEALYHRLVHLVLRLVTEQLQGESKAISQSIKIMELPSVDPGAGGFHGLLLQNLSEACFGRVLHAARSPEGGVLRDGSDEQARAAEDLCEELMKACESQDVGRVKAWAQAKSQVQGLMQISGETVTISGACGAVKHALNKSFVSAASGTTVSQDLLQVLGQSSCKFWRSLADVSPGAVSGIDAAQEALDVLDWCFQGEAKAKTWLLCCLRPNDTGQADRVNRQVMLRQVEQMRLADAVHLSSGHCIMWPLKAFRHQYSSLAPTLNDSMSDEDACRLLVKSTGGGEGTVGKDKVYGGEILEQLMEHKLEESQVGAQHLEGTKSEMRKLMEEKLEADQMRARQQEEQLEKAQQEIDNMRGQHHDVAKQQQELLQKLQEQQLELQKQQQEQMEALRQQQMMELERLRKQQEDASAAAQAEPAKQPSAAPETSADPDHEPDEEQPSVGAESAERPPVEALRPLLPKTWRFCQGMEGTESTRRSYPAAHEALAQMAALLRVAKEREQCMVEYELFQQETMHDLKSECEGWRKEAQLLHLQVSDLQRGLQDPTWRRAANRSNLATALALPTQVIERAASR